MVNEDMKPNLRIQKLIITGQGLPPLGEPPEALTGAELKAWHLIVSHAFDGVLRRSDRRVLELAARLYPKIHSGQCDNSTGRKLLRSILFNCGIPKLALGV